MRDTLTVSFFGLTVVGGLVLAATGTRGAAPGAVALAALLPLAALGQLAGRPLFARLVGGPLRARAHRSCCRLGAGRAGDRGAVSEVGRRVMVPRMAHIDAHITGTVWRVTVSPGDHVDAGDTVIILESMKMEMPVEAEDGGTVREVLVEEGQTGDGGRSPRRAGVTAARGP